ncbi:hypothetical protein [Gracilibacillus lacisalsi]|nr:hypothetical protein [Gracilibacillus lacisalsi]
MSEKYSKEKLEELRKALSDSKKFLEVAIPQEDKQGGKDHE